MTTYYWLGTSSRNVGFSIIQAQVWFSHTFLNLVFKVEKKPNSKLNKCPSQPILYTLF